MRLLTEKDTSGKNLTTSHLQLSGEGCQYGEEDSKEKFKILKNGTFPVKKIIIFLFCLPAG